MPKVKPVNMKEEHGTDYYLKVDLVASYIIDKRLYGKKNVPKLVNQWVCEEFKIGERMAYHLIRDAKIKIKNMFAMDFQEAFNLELADRESIISHSKNKGDYFTALIAAQDRAKLKNLYQPDRLDIIANVKLDLGKITTEELRNLATIDK